MKISIIVARSSNNAIGINNTLPWHLPADLKRFKSLTMGHHIIMGRKTYESIGKPLPGRTSIIVTRNSDYKADGCVVVGSIHEAVAVAKRNNESEAFIIGGADLINQSECISSNMYLTEIHQDFDGDVFLNLNSDWVVKSIEKHDPDEKNEFSYSFVDLVKKSNG